MVTGNLVQRIREVGNTQRKLGGDQAALAKTAIQAAIDSIASEGNLAPKRWPPRGSRHNDFVIGQNRDRRAQVAAARKEIRPLNPLNTERLIESPIRI